MTWYAGQANGSMRERERDTDTSDDERGLSLLVMAVNGAVLFATLVLGLVINAVLVSVIRRSKKLWTLTNGLLAWEAASKLVVVGVCVPVHLASIAVYPSVMPAPLCKTHAILNSVGNILGSSIITSVAYLRYLTVCHGTTFLLRRRRLLIWVFPSCLFTVIVTTLQFVLQPESFLCLNRSAVLSHHHSDKVAWLFGLTLSLHVLVACYSYARMGIVLCRHEKRLAVTSKTPQSAKIPPTTKQRMRMDIITTVSGAFHVLLCLLTFFPIVLFVPLAQQTIDDRAWAEWLSLLLTQNYFLLSLGDLVLFAIVCKALRRELVSALFCMNRNRKPVESVQYNFKLRVKFISVPDS